MTTQPEWKQAIRDHIAWCRAERDAALAQIAFFTTGGAKALVQNGDTPPQDITEGVLKHGRAVAEKMGSIIEAYEYQCINGQGSNIADLLAMPGLADVELELPSRTESAKPVDLS